MEHEQTRFSRRRIEEMDRQRAIAREHEEARQAKEARKAQPEPRRQQNNAGIGGAPSPVGENDLA